MAGAAEIQLFPSEGHKDEENSIRHMTNFVTKPVALDNEDDVRKKEEVILELGNMLAKRKQIDALKQMIQHTRPFLVSLGKAKAAKLVRNLVDLFCGMEASGNEEEVKNLQNLKVGFCRECIQWAREQNRVFLRQTLEARLVKLYNEVEKYEEALNLASSFVKELKKMDDKDLIVEVQLEESKACYQLGNLTKARAALTSARTTANAIYVNPVMQAALDMQSGILHAAEEKDFKTAFSYFYEAFEGYDSAENLDALSALKYMLLCKIMLNLPDDVQALLSSKVAIKYVGREMDAMKAVADASKKRSLADFKEAYCKYKDELQADHVIKAHFQTLYDRMLEKNLCRIIDPFSRIQISHIAKVISLPEPQGSFHYTGLDHSVVEDAALNHKIVKQNQVEKKLSQMILDEKLHGILDQGEGILVIFDYVASDKTYAAAIETVHELNHVVDSLYRKAKKLS